MGGDFLIRPYQSGDEEEIVRLLERVFDGWPKIDLSCTPLDHWRWKYLGNPIKPHIINLLLSGDKIIGVDHSILVRIKIGDQFLVINYTADLAVHPDFRRMGLAKILIDESDKVREKIGVQCLYFVTRRSFMIKNYSKPLPFPILNLVRIQDIDKQIEAIPIKNSSFMKLGFRVMKIYNAFQNIFRGSFFSKKDLVVSEVERFDEKIDYFFDEVSPFYNFIIERNHSYLNWRYCDERAGDFIIKQVEENGSILGYCVLRINGYLKNYPIGFLVDLLTLPKRLDVVDLLVSESTKYFDENNVNIINCLIVKGHPYENVLKMHGFLDSRIKVNLVSNLEFMGKGKILRNSLPRETHFSYGDIDSLPVSISQSV